MEFINIGSTPAEESCLGVGHPLALQECAIYRRQLEREFPKGNFRVQGFDHDFGRYFEVVAYWEDGDEDGEEAAYMAEAAASAEWDDEARKELRRLRGVTE